MENAFGDTCAAHELEESETKEKTQSRESLRVNGMDKDKDDE